MKQQTSLVICIVSVLFIVVFQFIYYNKRVKRLEHAIEIETAKNNFLINQLDNQVVPYDSVYAKNGTVLFYKNGTLLGRSVTERE